MWVETDSPCTVEVLGRRERTWTVAGHHYALVCVEGLEPGTSTPYDVRLDGDLVWPPADRDAPAVPHPHARLRRPVRLAFGSCRYATPAAVATTSSSTPTPSTRSPAGCWSPAEDEWPDALAAAGRPGLRRRDLRRHPRRIRARRDITDPPGDQVRRLRGVHLALRRVLDRPARCAGCCPRVPSSMIFDDHDMRDDWNTSDSWRRDMQATVVVGGADHRRPPSYWVYQHLGNLSPAELAEDDALPAGARPRR